MKKIFLLIVAFAAQINFAQNVFPLPSGNVGIGTTAPLYKLQVSGYHNDSQILLHSAGAGYPSGEADLMLWASEPEVSLTGVGISNNVAVSTNMGLHLLNSIRGGSYLRLLDNSMSFGTVSSSGVNKQALVINIEGNVGIGTTNPQNKLSLVDDSGNQFIASYTGGKIYQNYKYTGISYGESIGYNGSGANIGYMSHQNDKSLSGLYFTNYGESEHISSLFIRAGGNVGIGTITPMNKLDVNGTIHSKEVKVDMLGWSDFVFKKEYNLPTLEEVERHIIEKGHLKNIPNEEEVLKNGINLGEMNAKLLQKIEELTLYMIEMKKENEIVKNENKLMKKNQLELERRILEIENK